MSFYDATFSITSLYYSPLDCLTGRTLTSGFFNLTFQAAACYTQLAHGALARCMAGANDPAPLMQPSPPALECFSYIVEITLSDLTGRHSFLESQPRRTKDELTEKLRLAMFSRLRLPKTSVVVTMFFDTLSSS